MALPSLDDITLPLLRVLADGAAWRVRDASKRLEPEFALTEEDLRETVTGGGQKFLNRVWWARTHLVKAGLAQKPRRGFLQITDAGRGILCVPPPRLDARTLAALSPEFRAFFYGGEAEPEPSPLPPPEITPLEQIEHGVERLNRELRTEILERLRECSPDFFERLVVKVLVAMGYGGDLQDAGRPTGRPGDEGIDGIIKEDRLGLDKIYLQAKRWTHNVGGPEIQTFIGALQMKHARKGVFITTSDFTPAARAAVRNLPATVVLIHGEQLADLMIEYQVGVAVEHHFRVCRLDEDAYQELE